MKKKIEHKLYRELNEIFHPSISRQNISNYKIIMQDSLIPVGVYYPKKGVSLDNMIIYITNENSEICKDLALYTNHLVLVVDYHQKDCFSKCYEMVKYIYDHIGKQNKEHITMMCDQNYSSILEKIIAKSKKTEDFCTNKEIFLSSNMTVKVDENKLFIPDINSNYSFYSNDQVFEIINEFLA